MFLHLHVFTKFFFTKNSVNKSKYIALAFSHLSVDG